jgi:predicted AlkP superfamily phosphohydrolase/phosphomutase
MKNKKVLIIGFDGATWDLIKPWTEQNELPHLKKLMENGCYGSMKSTIPHVTPPAWTSMTTGKNPGKHGIFDFTNIKKIDDSLSFVLNSSKNKKSKEIWDYLKEKSIVANVPLTYPPHKINGMMVTGMYTPSTKNDFTYPPELKNEILKLFPKYKMELNWGEYKNNKQSFIKDLYEMTDLRIKLFWHLFNFDWSFLFFVFIGTDRLQHINWNETELLVYYKYLDNFLGDVIKKIKNNNTNLFLVSDHGFAKLKKIIHINAILNENGYLKLKDEQKDRYLDKIGINKKLVWNILLKFKLMRFYNKIPVGILHFARKTIPGKSNPIYDFDLKNSKAVMVGTGLIYIFENNKSVKEHIEDEIINKLENLTDFEDGEKVIETVFRKKELYSGDFCTEAADLVILPKKGYYFYSDISKDIIETPQFHIADHAINGIFLAYGPDIKKSFKINEIKIYDIAPTILHMFDLPLPNDMDGKVLKKIFSDDSESAKKEIEYNEYDQEKEKLKMKIKNLKLNGKI